METMIALGVMTILITGFLAVFGPATGSIRRALSVEEANRLQSTLEREMSIIRPGEIVDGVTNPTSFDKAFQWILESYSPQKAVILYKYKGDPEKSRDDGTLEPFLGDGVAGKEYIVQPMARLQDDSLLAADFEAISGRVYFVTMTQLEQDGANGLKVGTPGEIENPPNDSGDPDWSQFPTDSADYVDAVIALEAGFYSIPTVSLDYITTQIDTSLPKYTDPADPEYIRPDFTRNLGVRR